jgi:hypothetical protein
MKEGMGNMSFKKKMTDRHGHGVFKKTAMLSVKLKESVPKGIGAGH